MAFTKYSFTCFSTHRGRRLQARRARYRRGGTLSLYTILSLPNIVWCMASTGRVGGGSYIAQNSPNCIAVVKVVQLGGCD